MKNGFNSTARILVGTLALASLVVLMVVCLIPLLPWRIARLRVGNVIARAIGRTIVFCSGCPITIVGLERARSGQPAIIAGNHTSALDAFLSIWLIPNGTIGVAKRSILYYPFYGQVWWLAGHLSIDRGSGERARKSLSDMGALVKKNRLSVCMWPEGTRSRSGELLPFKKGVVHLAIQTGLPVVPMVISGAHRAWENKTLAIRTVPIRVEFLPPIDTSKWKVETIDEHLAELRNLIASRLPVDQRPIAEPQAKTSQIARAAA